MTDIYNDELKCYIILYVINLFSNVPYICIFYLWYDTPRTEMYEQNL